MNAPGLRSPRGRLRFCGLFLAAIVVFAPAAFAGVNRWTTSGPFGLRISSLAIDPTDPGTVYAGTGGEVFKTRDGGLSWTTCLQVPSDPAFFTSGLAIDPRLPTDVYAAMPAGVFKSVDAGNTWEAVGGRLSDMRAFTLAIDPLAPSNIYVGTAGGLFKSTDGGAGWSGPLHAAWLYSLVFPAQSPSTIFGADIDYSFYYSSYPTTLFKSSDGGATWSHSNTGIHVPPGALTIDPSNPLTLYAGNLRGGGVYKSMDSGSTWRRADNNPRLPDVSAVVIDPRSPLTLYAGTSNQGVFQSTDGGISWRELNNGLREFSSIAALAIDPTGTRLHAGTASGEVFSYQMLGYGALDLSVGADNQSHLIFVDHDDRAVFRSFDNSGRSTGVGFHGPFSGWSPTALADGSDGLTRVLWNHLDGSAALWLLGPAGNLASYRYAPGPGWTAVDVSVGPDNATHILWTSTDGRTSLWSLNVSGTVVGTATFGPYRGWLAKSISTGMGGLTRLLWSNTDGRVGLSSIDAGQIVATYRFAPPPGWTPRDVAVASDDQARILLVHSDGRMVLWSVDNSGTVTNSGTVYEPPIAGQTATRISAGADGSTRVLWTSPEGAGTVWLMGPDNVRQSSFGFDPDPCNGCWDY